jgi:hypothetical protein
MKRKIPITQSTSFDYDYIGIGPTTSSYITSCKGSLGTFYIARNFQLHTYAC